jgi:hypothetical protein
MNTIDDVYNSYCRKRFPLLTEHDVADLESRIGVTFPEDYRRFVLEYNGGFFSEPDIAGPIKRDDALECMDGIRASHPIAELASERSLSLFDDNDPPQIIPIGSTVNGALIILTVVGAERGWIVYKWPSGGSCFLACDIREFFGLLREPGDD